MNPKFKKRYVLGVGYPDECHSDYAVCLHKNEWRNEHIEICNKLPPFDDKKYRLVLERVK